MPTNSFFSRFLYVCLFCHVTIFFYQKCLLSLLIRYVKVMQVSSESLRSELLRQSWTVLHSLRYLKKRSSKGISLECVFCYSPYETHRNVFYPWMIEFIQFEWWLIYWPSYENTKLHFFLENGQLIGAYLLTPCPGPWKNLHVPSSSSVQAEIFKIISYFL